MIYCCWLFFLACSSFSIYEICITIFHNFVAALRLVQTCRSNCNHVTRDKQHPISLRLLQWRHGYLGYHSSIPYKELLWRNTMASRCTKLDDSHSNDVMALRWKRLNSPQSLVVMWGTRSGRTAWGLVSSTTVGSWDWNQTGEIK